jgi:hypothetical protein
LASTYNELGLGICLQDPREDIGDEVHTLLQTPSSNEHKQLGVFVLLEASPLLSLAPELASALLECLVDCDFLAAYEVVLAPFGGVLFTVISASSSYQVGASNGDMRGDEERKTLTVGSGLGSCPIFDRPQKIGYRAYDRSPYFLDTPTAPKPFW